MRKDSLQKLFMFGFLVSFSKVSLAELVSLSEEEERSATAQASIEVEASLYTNAQSVTIEDAANPNVPGDIGGGRLRFEDFELGHNFIEEQVTSDNPNGRLDLKLLIEVVPVSELDPGTPAIALAEGDVLKQQMNDLNADVKIGAIRPGDDNSAPSFGQLFIDELEIDESVTYLYSIQDSQSIGIDTVINQTIGRVEYTDVETNGSSNPEGGGSIAFNDITMSELDLYGTRLNSVSGNENPYDNSAAVQVTLPSITNGFVSIGGIQIGGERDRNSAAYYDQQVAAVTMSGLQNDASTLYLYTPTLGDGVRLAQSMDLRVDDLTVVGGSLDVATAVRRSLAYSAEQVRQDLNQLREDRGYVDPQIGNPAAGFDAEYDQLFTSLTSLEGELATLDDVDTATLEARAEELNAGYYQQGNEENDGVGSLSFKGLTISSDESIVSIDIDSDNALVISAPVTNGRIGIEDIYIGSNSIGGISVEGLNIPVNEYRITGKQ
ncbi:hypothetical protein [Parendozoicomonas sp. Alg238-R29]|uniref:hypothetical protein n=1 Tax=Parendozoicomonas sp. Alg238-R29 TaxID=2993446 RepID=UPI00248D4661|nr:hypothetical protein [Parendozoicomonas sp. Alg238-R29]